MPYAKLAGQGALRPGWAALEGRLPDEALDDRCLAVRPYPCPLEIVPALPQRVWAHRVRLASWATRRVLVVNALAESHTSIVLDVHFSASPRAHISG